MSTVYQTAKSMLSLKLTALGLVAIVDYKQYVFVSSVFKLKCNDKSI